MPPAPAWPSGSVNGQVFDYGMDPDVVNSPAYRDLMDDALLSISSISLVTNLANLFDPAKGIYVHAGSEGRDWERPVSVELIHPDGREGFQIDAGIRIRGGFSRGGSNPKHSFRLFFRAEYGPPALKYPLFESEGADEFENIDLRTSQNYAWSLDSSNPGEKNTFVREEFCRDLQRETGQPYTRTRYYHLYINGQYWGLYESQERSEASYAATYFGGEPDDYDVIMTDSYRTSYTDGTIDEWNLLWGLCQQGFETDERYYAVQGKRARRHGRPEHSRARRSRQPHRLHARHLLHRQRRRPRVAGRRLGQQLLRHPQSPDRGTRRLEVLRVRQRAFPGRQDAASTTTGPVRSPPASRAITSTRSGCTRS